MNGDIDYVPFKPANAPDWDFQAPTFNTGNWQTRQPYLCRPCYHIGTHRPPAAIIEWVTEEYELTSDYTPVCYTHLNEQNERWQKWVTQTKESLTG